MTREVVQVLMDTLEVVRQALTYAPCIGAHRGLLPRIDQAMLVGQAYSQGHQLDLEVAVREYLARRPCHADGCGYARTVVCSCGLAKLAQLVRPAL